MRKLISIMAAIALLSMPFTIYAQSDQKPAAPPISQTLIPEGDFALKLAPALELGTPNNEAQAEDMLTSAGIAPKNGWIADYPITPNIVGELQSAVATAADLKKLPMEKDDALKAFQSVTTEFGLVITPGGGQYAENQAPTSSEYVQPQEINNYYYEEGPPVVSYYPPPWDYYYLYDWVPYPFWYSGFFFPGFFILNDFDTFVFVGHHHHRFRITNHFFNHRTRAFGRVDPVHHSWTNFSHTTAFHSTATRNAASSIFNRSTGRTTFARGTRGMTGNHASSFGTVRGRVATNNRGNTVGGGRSFHSFNRSFSAPPSHGSFSGGHSFSGFSGSQSFSGFSGSHVARGFSVGHSSSGFSGGHSFGGFSGGHSSGGFSGGHTSGGFSGGHSFGGGGFHGGGGGRR
jgi:hypothetical protein